MFAPSRPRRPRARRRGLSLLVFLAVLSLLAFALGLTSARRSQSSLDWLTRLDRSGARLALLESAVSEAEYEFMLACNDPTTALFRELRDPLPEGLRFTPELGESQLVAASMSEVEALGVEVHLREVSSFHVDFEPQQEWEGVLEVRARLTPRGGGSAQELLQRRQVRSTSVSPPRPLDRYCYFDHRDPQPGQVQGSFEISRSYWSRKASLRLRDRGQGIQAAYEELRERLPVLNGVVYVENPGETLRLTDLRHQGRTVLVVEGGLDLVDIRLEDASRDQLTILAFGDVQVAGELEASLVLTRAPSDLEPRRTVHIGTEILGAFVLTEGEYHSDRGFQLDCRPQISGPAGSLLLDRHLYVSVSPVIQERRLQEV